MKKAVILTSFVFAVTLNCQIKTADTPAIDAEEGLKLHENPEYIFLDVRTHDEHRDKAITNSILIPLHELEKRLTELNQYSGKKILVYCRSGNRSKKGADILRQHKFDAFNLSGGILNWKGPLITKGLKKG